MKKILSTILVLCVALSFSDTALAVGSAGFENASFSPRGMAQAGAGTAAPVEPSAISYNPAGLTELKGAQLQSSANFINHWTFFENNNVDGFTSRATTLPFATSYLSVNPGSILGDRVAFGVGMDAPFGLVRQYPSQHPATRFTGYDTWLKMYSIKPVVSVKLHDKLSVGAGPVYYRVMDFGTALVYPTLGAATGSNARLTTRGQNWGWQLGVLAKPHEKHQLGFYFRSPVTMKLSGKINVEGSVTSGRFETAARTKMDLPLNFTWAYAYKPSEKTTLMADFGFTRWSAFKRLYVDFDPVANANDNAVLNAVTKQDKDYRNSFSIHLAANHKVTKKLELMTGVSFYTRAQPDSNFIPAVPDSNRLNFGLGVIYALTNRIDLGLSYFGMFFLSNSVDNNLGGTETATSSVDGKYTSYLHEWNFSFTYKWEDLFDKMEKENVAESKDMKRVA